MPLVSAPASRMTPKHRRPDGQLRFGLMWPNSPAPNVTSGAVAERNPSILDVDVHMELARTAERIGVDFAFFADGYTHHGADNARVGHGEPCVSAPIWAAAVMAATQHIGVVTTMHTRYLSPVVLARIGANLDVLSGGRWGWNVVPGAKDSEARLFGIDASVEHDVRYRMAAETIEACKALWRADGAPVEFHGEYHHLSGTPRGPYPIQKPWPLLFNAGVSPAGQELIASTCDFAFFPVADDLEKVRGPVEDLAARTEAHGRDPLEVNMAGSIGVIVEESRSQAEETYAWVRENLDLPAARGWARGFFGGSQTYQKNFSDQQFDDAARKIGIAAGSRMLVGTGEDVAEQLIEVHRATGLRGFMLITLFWAPEEIAKLAAIFPYLEKAGVWTRPEQREWSW